MKWLTVLLGVIVIVGCQKSDPSSNVATQRNDLDRRGKTDVCHVHNVKLVEETREAKPRFTVSWEPEFEKAMRSEFPYLGHAFGIADLDVTHVTVRYCPKCRHARDQWHRDDAEKRKQKP